MTNNELKEHAEAILAYLAGKPVEYRYVTDDFWRTALADRPLFANTETCRYRPKPEPKMRPWTFNERPREVVWVYKKGYITDWLITAWRDDGVWIGNYAKLSYEELLEQWEQRDGSPCGITE